MASPAKRRKTNKPDPAASKTVRGLDFFFNKQKTTIPAAGSSQDAQDNVKHEEVAGTVERSAEAKEETDEELARRLQEEWNRADGAPVLANGQEVAERSTTELRIPDDQVFTEEEDAKQPDSPTIDTDTKTTPSNFLQPTKHTLGLQTATAAEDTITYTIPFDQSPLSFDPSEYVSQLQSQWSNEGGSATYALLTHAFVLVGSTQSRIKIVDTLVNLLRVIIEGDPSSLLPAVWLATNSISPPYIDLELGLGGSAISKALKKVCGLDNAALKTLYNKYGDAGDVAFEAKKRQSMTLRKPKPLSIKSVYESLVKIANSKGQGSVEAKQRIVERLVQDARGAEESRYIVRTLVQHLRIGAVKTTMLIALSRAFLLSKPSNATYTTRSTSSLIKLKKDQLAEVYSPGEELLKASFARRPNYNDLVAALLEIGISDELLIRCGLDLHVPLRPMLGNITRDLGEMLTKLQGRDFSCEFKYDGQRAQVHCDDKGKVTIFSRHLEVMTDKYPDLVALVPKIRGEGVRSFILEGEVVAIDPDNGDLKTFQTLANRARKDVLVGAVKIDVCLFAFDLMYLNGEQLLDRSFRERRSLLRSLFTEIPKRFTWVKSLDATSGESETVLEFFKSATDIKCEGIMVKVLDNLPNPELQKQLEDGGIDGLDPAGVLPAPPPTPSKRKGKAVKLSTTTTLTEAKTTGRRKALVSTYEPDKRSDSWLKVKKDYAASTDTLDLIPVGGWHGQGRKAAWWSPVLLAVRNPETGALQAVTKCISGFTDKFYKEMREKYDPGRGLDDGNDGEEEEDFGDGEGEGGGGGDATATTGSAKHASSNCISRPAYLESPLHPDVYFNPQEVWEISFADITLSPTYTAAIGLVDEARGLSTRFPRFLKVREDKSIEEASTSGFLAGLWRKQAERVGVEGGAGVKVEEEDGEGELEME